MFSAKKLAFTLLLAGCLLQVALAATAAPAKKPIIIAHRGASAYRPEHTLAAYDLAIDTGADFVEPDLCMTRDGVLVARHENDITGTTDVADHPEFAGRRAKKTIDGEAIEGWFTEDFTLAELKTLRATERMPAIRQKNTIYNGRYTVPTFQEIIDLVKKKSAEQHRRIGIYPESKHPSYFAALGMDSPKAIVETLHHNGYREGSDPIFIQCFEPGALKTIRKLTSLPLIQLIDDNGKPYDWVLQKDSRTFADMCTPAGLREISMYAQGIGPRKHLIVPWDSAGKLASPTTLVADAHKVGLQVHPWTFRNENMFLPKDFQSSSSDGDYGNAFAEYKLFYEQGVDGVFSESPDTALEVRDGQLY
jgi:glycerophosphoryl diester phosphodiesterase